MLWILLGLVITGALAVIISVISIEKYQHNRNQKVIRSLASASDSSRTLIVFFSRSGNTELMARKIASLKKAVAIPMNAERYCHILSENLLNLMFLSIFIPFKHYKYHKGNSWSINDCRI